MTLYKMVFMKKIVVIGIILILISPVFATTGEDNFQNWVDNYYSSNKIDSDDLEDLFNDLNDENPIDKSDFQDLKYVYKTVYGDDSKIITDKMDDDFKNFDVNGDGELTLIEFKNGFSLVYSFYRDSPKNYDFFLKTDSNGDGLISFSEFDEISYIFTEDSFWDGYSIEEIIQSEWDMADRNNDDYLNYTEFKKVI